MLLFGYRNSLSPSTKILYFRSQQSPNLLSFILTQPPSAIQRFLNSHYHTFISRCHHSTISGSTMSQTKPKSCFCWWGIGCHEIA